MVLISNKEGACVALNKIDYPVLSELPWLMQPSHSSYHKSRDTILIIPQSLQRCNMAVLKDWIQDWAWVFLPCIFSPWECSFLKNVLTYLVLLKQSLCKCATTIGLPVWFPWENLHFMGLSDNAMQEVTTWGVLVLHTLSVPSSG